ncbi:hypothetical protein ACFU5O_02385 [Streptomyces sp. NPDC057445]|uniref:hypothetical protein n=1 Tax=Streptomyces sp. NPDC057445 TaxID=3346136 RepID=UPI00369A9528
MNTRKRRVPLLAALAAGAVATGTLVLTGAGGSASDAAPAAARTALSPRAGQWQSTPVPVAKGDLTAVAALSATQAWAVGYRLTSTNQVEALALRWDGTSWKQQSTLPPNSFPQALAVRAAGDIWSVGTTTAHWNGTSWTAHDLARDPNGRVVPDAVATTSDGKAWTVGRAVPQSVKNAVPAVQSWDGSAWRRQSLPDVGKGELTGLTVIAPDDIWAVGAAYATDGAEQTALLLHFDGTSWKRVAAPAARKGEHRWLAGVTATAAGDVWAVGGAVTEGSERPFAVRWDGEQWSTAPTPDVPDGRLRAVGRGGDGTLWAVGGKGAVSLALRWDAQQRRWSQAPDPGVVIRGFSAVPGTGGLWTVGIAKRGDLVPAATRYGG